MRSPFSVLNFNRSDIFKYWLRAKTIFLFVHKMLKVHRLILLCAMMLTQGASLENEREAQILKKEYTIGNDGNYNFSYETSNGISRSEIGTVINKGQPNEHVVVEGRNSYINAKGEEQIFRYVADENGYRVLPLPRVVAEFVPPPPVASLLGGRN